MQEFGKEGFALQTHRGIDDLSHCGLAPPLFSRSRITCSLFPPKWGIVFCLSHTTVLWKDHGLGRTYPTHVRIEYLWLDKRLSQSMFEYVSECRFSSKFKCFETVELNVYVRTLPNHSCMNSTSKDGMGKQRTDRERRVKSGRQVLPMMHGKKGPPDPSQNF